MRFNPRSRFKTACTKPFNAKCPRIDPENYKTESLHRDKDLYTRHAREEEKEKDEEERRQENGPQPQLFNDKEMIFQLKKTSNREYIE